MNTNQVLAERIEKLIRELVERVEFEYIRHGTLCLIANFNLATGGEAQPR